MSFNKFIQVCDGVSGADKSAMGAIDRPIQMVVIYFLRFIIVQLRPHNTQPAEVAAW